MSKKKKTDFTENTQNGDKLNIKAWIIGASIVILFFCLLYFSYLGINALKNKENPISFSKVSDGVIKNDETGEFFLKLSDSYEPRLRVTNKKYGKAGDLSLYRIAYEKNNETYYSPDNSWLCTSSEDGSDVYVKSGTFVPDLEDFKWDTLYVCTEEEGEINVSWMSLTGNAADLVIKEYLDKNVYTGGGSPYETYKIRITSFVYGWLYYDLNLVRCDNGDYYIYSCDTDRKGYSVDPSHFTQVFGGAAD